MIMLMLLRSVTWKSVGKSVSSDAGMLLATLDGSSVDHAAWPDAALIAKGRCNTESFVSTTTWNRTLSWRVGKIAWKINCAHSLVF